MKTEYFRDSMCSCVKTTYTNQISPSPFNHILCYLTWESALCFALFHQKKLYSFVVFDLWQNIPEPKAVDMVLAGKEEAQSLGKVLLNDFLLWVGPEMLLLLFILFFLLTEHNFVPDTQPRSKINM